MKNLLEHFECGRYLNCVQALEKLQATSFQPSQVQATSNSAVCKILMQLSDSTVDCIGVSVSCLKELQKCLLQIQSFPPALVNMETELTILYNWLYLKLVLITHSSMDDPHAVLSECNGKYFKSLSRVLASVKHKSAPDAYENEAIVLQLQLLAKYSELLKVYKILSPLCFAGCAWSTLLMYCGKLKEGLTCLKSLTGICVETSDVSQMNMSPTGLVLSLPNTEMDNTAVSDPTPGLSSREMVHLQKGLCHYRLSEWTDCRDCLAVVKTQAIQPQIKYIIGLCHLEEGHPDDCISSLRNIAGDDSSIPPRIRARVLHLLGQCYDKKGLHQCAVQMFREALQIDFSFVLPIYHISQQYQRLGLEDAELEALNLLATILEDSSDKKTPGHQLPVTSLWTSDIFQQACPDPTISLVQALYTLGHRCLQLHRYSVGAQRFLDLLALLCDTQHLPVTKVKVVSSCVMSLPEVRVIYLETAQCLLHAGQHDNCVSVCDKALESVCLSLDTSATSLGADDISYLLAQDESEELSQTLTFSSRKRQRTASCDIELTNQNSDRWQELRYNMTLTLYKVDALIGLREEDTAAQTLHRAIEALVECIGCWSEGDGARMPQTAEPAPKRRRMVDDEVLIKTDNDDDDRSSGLKTLLVDGCCKLSSLLADQEKYADALHYSRLAIQIHPGERKAWLTCCSVLHRQGREEEAARTWLQYQGVMDTTDRQYLGKELHTRQEQLRKLSSHNPNPEAAGDITSKSVLEMDVRSLEYFVKRRQSIHR